MENPDTNEWVELHLFEDGELAHDVTTSILSMEFEASLVDLSDGSVCAGVGGMLDVDVPETNEKLAPTPEVKESPTFASEGNFKIAARFPWWNSMHLPPETGEVPRGHRSEGGPWSLRVPFETRSDLFEVLDTIIEERNAFEHRIEQKHSLDRKIMLFFFVAIAVVALVYLIFVF